MLNHDIKLQNNIKFFSCLWTWTIICSCDIKRLIKTKIFHPTLNTYIIFKKGGTGFCALEPWPWFNPVAYICIQLICNKIINRRHKLYLDFSPQQIQCYILLRFLLAAYFQFHSPTNRIGEIWYRLYMPYLILEKKF